MQQNHKNIKVIQKRYKKRTKKKWDKEQGNISNPTNNHVKSK